MVSCLYSTGQAGGISLPSVDLPFDPFPVIKDRVVQKFKAKLSAYPKKSVGFSLFHYRFMYLYAYRYYDIDGCEVGKTFFQEIYTPQQWIFRTVSSLPV